MNYSALALLFISSVYALEGNDLQDLVQLKNAQRYEITYSGFDGEINSIKNHSMIMPESWNTTITLFFNEGCSGSITYKGELKDEKLVNAIHEFDRSIQNDIQKQNESNNINLLTRQYKAIHQCCAALVLLGLPLLDVIYQFTFSAL